MENFVNFVSIVFNEINDDSNKNSGSVLQKILFWIDASYSYDNVRNSWLWYLHNFIIMIARCVNEWILELFKFPCIVPIYAWFFMHCRNHNNDRHANHVIIYGCALLNQLFVLKVLTYRRLLGLVSKLTSELCWLGTLIFDQLLLKVLVTQSVIRQPLFWLNNNGELVKSYNLD